MPENLQFHSLSDFQKRAVLSCLGAAQKAGLIEAFPLPPEGQSDHHISLVLSGVEIPFRFFMERLESAWKECVTSEAQQILKERVDCAAVDIFDTCMEFNRTLKEQIEKLSAKLV